MTMVIGVAYGDEARISSDTALTFDFGGRKEHVSVGSKLYRLHERLAIGLAGYGAFAHHLVGDILAEVEYRMIPIEGLPEMFRRGRFQKKIEALSQIDSAKAKAIGLLAAGFNAQGRPEIRKFSVDQQTCELIEAKAPPRSTGSVSYELDIIGSGHVFRPEIEFEIDGCLSKLPAQFPSGYEQVLSVIIKSPFLSVGGSIRTISMSARNGFRMWKEEGRGSIRSAAGRGFNASDFKLGIEGGVYQVRLIHLLGYMFEHNDCNAHWIDQLRARKVTEAKLLELIPRFAKKIADFHPEHVQHDEIIELFIKGATSNATPASSD